MNFQETKKRLENDTAYKWSVENKDIKSMQIVLRDHDLPHNYEFAEQCIINTNIALLWALPMHRDGKMTGYYKNEVEVF
jgi:hypothetical protein